MMLKTWIEQIAKQADFCPTDTSAIGSIDDKKFLINRLVLY